MCTVVFASGYVLEHGNGSFSFHVIILYLIKIARGFGSDNIVAIFKQPLNRCQI